MMILTIIKFSTTSYEIFSFFLTIYLLLLQENKKLKYSFVVGLLVYQILQAEKYFLVELPKKFFKYLHCLNQSQEHDHNP